MKRFGIVVVLVILAGVCESLPTNITEEFSNQIKAEIEAIGNINVFQPLDLQSLTTGDRKNVKQQIVYTLGHRIPGDRLVSTNTDSKTWPSPQDVTLTLSYPTSGVGATVTYVQIVVNQSTNVGKGSVTAGGIGQRFIHLVIQGYGTTFFNYVAQIYGL